MRSNRFFVLLLSLILSTSFIASTDNASAAEHSIVWKAPTGVPAGTPLFVKQETDADESLQLVEAETGTKIPLQKSGEEWIGLFPREIKEGETLDFTVSAVPPVQAASAVFNIVQKEGCLVVSNRGREVFRYRTDSLEPPMGQSNIYRRSGYLHPLYTPRGKLVTGDFAADHPHQHGIMYAWTNTSFQGRKVDFWNQSAEQGRIEHRKIVAMGKGPVFAEIEVKIAHVDLTSGNPIDVLHEHWKLRVYDIGPDTNDNSLPYIIDFESVQEAATDEPLKILEYHYGGFAIRGNESWLGRDPNLFLTSLGMKREDGNHSRPNWCRMQGELGRGTAGVVLISHEHNFRAPIPVRLHPAKPYFCWAPLVLGDFEISKQNPLRSRFRIVSYDGEGSLQRLHQLSRNFSQPVWLDAR
ncbi:DUF6807 domain-containing protein [Polystyrenella longa]|uniref:DUF6807 domain-containing protein n=1 Tax=Polystyrenella longa TaxID=2528007 RepID=UPI0018D20A9E|nr:PmoA family protein [Polystyrenella longa]